jgi:hypothetical protein
MVEVTDGGDGGISVWDGDNQGRNFWKVFIGCGERERGNTMASVLEPGL